MKPKHLKANLEICEATARLSSCPRRKFGAVLIDPRYNTIVAAGYNGPPRGGVDGGLCAGSFCERDGLTEDMVTIVEEKDMVTICGEIECTFRGVRLKVGAPGQEPLVVEEWGSDDGRFGRRKQELLAQYPPILSGTHMEKGCHHAESNCIANACRRGAATEGTWLIVTGECCLMCAKLAHHAGISKVFVVKGGYAGGDAGVRYLQQQGVMVEYVEGPQDPRSP